MRSYDNRRIDIEVLWNDLIKLYDVISGLSQRLLALGTHLANLRWR
jgi:hypothetical protein